MGPLTRSWTPRIRSWGFVGPLGPCSWRLTAHRRSSAGPLGLSPLRADPVTDDRDRQAQTLVRWSTRSCSRCFRWFSPFCHLYQTPRRIDSSVTGGASPDLSGSPRSPASPRHTSGQSQPSTSAVPLVPASNHGVRGTCRTPVLGLAPRRLLTLTRAHSCSRPLGRAEHVFRQTALAPTFSQWVPA